MTLRDELSLRKPLETRAHEALLGLYFTASRAKKFADEFFKRFGTTDVQFNVLILLAYQTGEAGGLTQVELSRMMLVNRANITALIDRMEKARLVARSAVKGDRRYNAVRLTEQGRELLKRVEPAYMEMVNGIIKPLSDAEQRQLIKMLDRIREATGSSESS